MIADAKRSRRERDLDLLLGASRFTRSEDGRRLHYRLLTPRSTRPHIDAPTIFWIAGMGMSGLSWAPFHQRAAQSFRSVLVDRAGLGLSDEDPVEPTLARAARDLSAVIDAVGSDRQSGPVVLVAHSWGGPIARIAADPSCVDPGDGAPQRSAAPVAALVLVEPSDEHLREGSVIIRRRSNPALQRAVRLLFTLTTARSRPADPDFVPARSTASKIRGQDLSPRTARTHLRELESFDRELDALHASPPRRRGIPTTIISGTLLPRSSRTRTRRTAMLAAHRRSVEEDPGIRHVRAEASGHLPQLTEPRLVLAEVLRAAREATRARG